MRFVEKQTNRPARILLLDQIKRVETEGYDPIWGSSRPPYGPRVERHGARVWHFSLSPLNTIRVISPEVDAQLSRLEEQIKELKKQHQQLLEDKFLTFRLATIEDFDPGIVRRGLTKEEARARLPKGKQAKEAAERAKALSKELSCLIEEGGK